MGGCSRAGPQLDCHTGDLFTEAAFDAPAEEGSPPAGLSPYRAELEGVRAWVLARPSGTVRCRCCLLLH